MPRRNRPTLNRGARRRRYLANVANAARWQAKVKSQKAKLRQHHATARVTANDGHR